MAQPLVIVESPAKARTIARYLGDDYVVESSIGHIRDLPRNASDVPKELKGEKWARLGVDTENHFKPVYVVSPEKKDHVRNLKRLLKDADELYLATDEDREGEAIAWHLLEVLNPTVPVRRMVFHEITPQAIQNALENPRELDRRLVDAQETRRILDRLYGYEVSPVLWRKIMRGLSAGRVQSVATRIIVERERERMVFKSGTWWDVQAEVQHANRDSDQTIFTARLQSVDGKRLASGKDFTSQGAIGDNKDVLLLNEAEATALKTSFEGQPFTVSKVESKGYTRKPAPPFMTSTLQQEAGRKLHLSSAMTMSTAQRLYENGFITYMRTDSTSLSETALSAARSQIKSMYGEAYLPASPRVYQSKVKNAQEAHEAIRPAGDTFRTPDEVASQLNATERKLYELIWKRTIASQMNNAQGETVHVDIDATTTDGRVGRFVASGRTITFPGFLRAYVEGSDNPDEDLDDQEKILPELEASNVLTPVEVEANGHTTQAPARYTEASLVKKLEELGVGRPSTYASIISTIQDRGYVWKKGSALIPSFTAFAVVKLMEQHFEGLVDYAFTARLESELDEIASGQADMEPWLKRFYWGDQTEDGRAGLKPLVDDALDVIDARDINSIPLAREEGDPNIVARVGRYGPYIEREVDGEMQRASIPDDLPPDELTIELAIKLLEAPSGDRILGTHPETGLPVELKAGRFGPYVQEGAHDDETGIKPRTASLFKNMDPATVTLENVLPLLDLPREVGIDPSDDQPILAYNGKFGPYLKKGTDSRSLETEEQILSVTLDEALKIFAEPKRRRGQAAPKGPLREMGNDPDSDKPIVIKDGRFGPYVTDGETNASLRKGDTVEEITFERALELLADRRARGPVKKKAKKATKKKAAAKKKAPAKKTAAKKTAAKKTAAKKTPAKKAAAKKATEDS